MSTTKCDLIDASSERCGEEFKFFYAGHDDEIRSGPADDTRDRKRSRNKLIGYQTTADPMEAVCRCECQRPFRGTWSDFKIDPDDESVSYNPLYVESDDADDDASYRADRPPAVRRRDRQSKRKYKKAVCACSGYPASGRNTETGPRDSRGNDGYGDIFFKANGGSYSGTSTDTDLDGGKRSFREYSCESSFSREPSTGATESSSSSGPSDSVSRGDVGKVDRPPRVFPEVYCRESDTPSKSDNRENEKSRRPGECVRDGSAAPNKPNDEIERVSNESGGEIESAGFRKKRTDGFEAHSNGIDKPSRVQVSRNRTEINGGAISARHRDGRSGKSKYYRIDDDPLSDDSFESNSNAFKRMIGLELLAEIRRLVGPPENVLSRNAPEIVDARLKNNDVADRSEPVRYEIGNDRFGCLDELDEMLTRSEKRRSSSSGSSVATLKASTSETLPASDVGPKDGIEPSVASDTIGGDTTSDLADSSRTTTLCRSLSSNLSKFRCDSDFDRRSIDATYDRVYSSNEDASTSENFENLYSEPKDNILYENCKPNTKGAISKKRLPTPPRSPADSLRKNVPDSKLITPPDPSFTDGENISGQPALDTVSFIYNSFLLFNWF